MFSNLLPGRTARPWVLLLFLSLISSTIQAQTGGRVTLTGTVRTSTGEGLPGASIAVSALNTGTAADSLGHFALSLPAGPERYTVLALTYCVVVFSILVRGLSIARVVRSTLRRAP